MRPIQIMGATRRELLTQTIATAAGLTLGGCEWNRSRDIVPAIATPTVNFAQGVRRALGPEQPAAQIARAQEATPTPSRPPLPTMETLYVRRYASPEEIRRASVHTPEQRQTAQEQFVRLNEYLLISLQKNPSFVEFVRENQLEVVTRLLVGDQIGVISAPRGVLAKVFPMNQYPQYGPELSLVQGTLVRWNTDVVLLNPNGSAGEKKFIEQIWISVPLPSNAISFYPRQLENDRLITLYPGSAELASIQTARVSSSGIEYATIVK